MRQKRWFPRLMTLAEKLTEEESQRFSDVDCGCEAASCEIRDLINGDRQPMTDTAQQAPKLSVISRNSISELAYIAGNLTGLLSRFGSDRELYTYLSERNYSLADLARLRSELIQLSDIFYR